jgi:GAF domain-containing protein
MMNEQGIIETRSAPSRPPAGRDSQRHDARQGSGWQAALDAERIQIATRILPILIGAAIVVGLASVVLYFALGRPWQWIGMMVEIVWATVFFLAAYLAVRRGHLTPTVYLTTLGILLTTIVGPALIEGIAVAGVMAGVVAIVFARLLAGRAQNNVVVIVSALGIAAGLLLSGFRVFDLLAIPFWVSTSLNVAVADVVIILIGMILDSRDARYEASLAQADVYAAHLDAQRETLEQRSHDLARRARYQEATTAIARDAASLLDLQVLLSRVVTLVSEQFGFYHTGIFLLDPLREWAVLQAASSEGGQRMLQRSHRLRVGIGIVGYVVDRGEPRIALSVGEDAVFFDNPDLPDTRSELAMPLRAGGEVIGALDVQSREPAAFSQEDVAVLQTLADQVAVAISNARLFRRVQESLEAERRAYGELSRDAWTEMLRAQPELGYSYSERAVVRSGRPAEDAQRLDKGLPKLKLQIKHRGQKLGTMVAHKPGDSGEWTSGEVELMETLAERLSVALESARLYQDTQRRAAREQLIGEATARMRETLDMEVVLKTAVDEIARSLGLAALDVRLGTGRSRSRDIDLAGDDSASVILSGEGEPEHGTNR